MITTALGTVAQFAEKLRHPTWFDQYNQFADACGIHQGNINEPVNINAVVLGRELVEEEWGHETQDALAKFMANPSKENIVDVADGIADTIYVLCQLARSIGIPLNQVFAEVQRTNMAKVGADGKVKRREDGKILKPDGWTPPDIWGIIYTESERKHKEAGTGGTQNWPKLV